MAYLIEVAIILEIKNGRLLKCITFYIVWLKEVYIIILENMGKRTLYLIKIYDL